MAKIKEEEAIEIRDNEIKEHYESLILKDAKGKNKNGVNGKPLLEDTAVTDKDGKLVSGYQITLND